MNLTRLAGQFDALSGKKRSKSEAIRNGLPDPAIRTPGTTGSSGGGMRFNPNVQLDPSQIDDRRRVPVPPPLNLTTTTGTIPQTDDVPTNTGLDQILRMFSMMLQRQQPSKGVIQYGKPGRRY